MKIKEEAEKIYPKNPFYIGSGDSARLYDEFKSQRDAYIAGATSNAAKEYWYKEFEKEKIEFAIKAKEEDMIDFATFRNGGDVREEFKLWEKQKLNEYE